MKKIYCFTAFVFASVLAFSQNLNPTVEVTRTYEGKLVEVHKAGTEVEVPDSLTKFNYNVDYSVFDNPYKGSYEFRPYVIEMKPEASAYDGKQFYFDAGCGYPLSPSGHFVYSPKVKSGSFGMSVYGDFDSYFGDMRGLDSTFRSEVIDARGGIAFYYDSPSIKMDFDANYSYFGSDDVYSKLGLGYTHLNFGITVPRERFVASLRIRGDFGGDDDLKDNSVGLDGYVGFPLKKAKFLDLGVSFGGFAFLGEGLHYEDKTVLYLSPKVGVGYFLVPSYLKVYAEATGFGKRNSYAFLRESDPFLRWDNLSSIMTQKDLLVSRAGFKGTAGSSFGYDINAGYSIVNDGAFYSSLAGEGGTLLRFCDYSLFRIGGDFVVDTDPLDLYFGGSFSSTSRLGDEVFGIPRYKAYFKGEYNWSRRIFARVSCEYCSERESSVLLCPEWTDLSLGAEYRFNSFFSVYLKAGNLLGQNIQRILFHAYEGVNIAGGISLKFGKN